MTKSTITRERLATIKSWRETYGAGSNVILPAEEAEELACLALAAIDSEPVAYAWVSRSGKKHLTRCEPEQWRDAVIVTPLYRHALHPVVPEDKPMPNPLSMYAVDAVAAIAEVKGWNACRAAMLNHPSRIQPNTDAAPGTEIKHPSSNSPVIPGGYVMVPKEPTPEMMAVINEAIKSMRGSAATYARVLAAAQQEMMKDEANNLSPK